MNRFKGRFKSLTEIGFITSDSPEVRLKKSIMTIMIIPYSLAGIVWGLYFIKEGNLTSGLIPLSYGIISIITFFYFVYTKRYNILRFSQVGFVLFLPFLLHLSLGGFSQSSGMLLWSCTAPFIALVFYDSSTAKKWFFALVALLIIACFLDEQARKYFSKHINSDNMVAVYGGNFILISSLIFSIQLYFMNGQKRIKIQLKEKELLLEESKEIEKQRELLSASKDRLELIMGSLQEVVWGRNLKNQKLEYISDSVKNLFGFPKQDWFENPNLWSDVIHPNDKSKVKIESEAAFDQTYTEMEYRILTANKEIKWINSKTRVLKKSDGTPFFMTGIAQDITQLVKAKKELFLSEKKYRELFDKSGDAELILENNVFVKCNDATIKMLGYSNKDEFLNQSPFDLSPEKQPDGQLSSEKSKLMNKIAYETGSNRFEWIHLKSNGDAFPVEVLLTSITSENVNDKTFHVAWRDITEQKNNQKQLNQLNDNLEIKVKQRTIELEESLEREKELGKLKTRFVSTASHQFRTPLAVIQSNAQLMEMLIKTGEKIEIDKYKKVSDRITDAIATMTGLMDDVLILGKISAGKVQFSPENIDLVEFSDKLVEEFNELNTYDSHLNFSIKGEPYNVNLDPQLLTHSLSNLISNAFKYSVGKKNPDLTIHFKPNEVVLTIKDYGIGIPADELPKLFQPFFRAKNVIEIKGTGLGLSIAKEYIETNKGFISLKSTEGEGSCFEITFKKILVRSE